MTRPQNPQSSWLRIGLAVVIYLVLIASLPLSIAVGKQRFQAPRPQASPSQALPSMVIYGEAFLKGTLVASGTLIAATCATFTMTTTAFALKPEPPPSNYSFSIPNDLPRTAQVEGCLPGQEVTFTVGGKDAPATKGGTTTPITVTWTTATFLNVDLAKTPLSMRSRTFIPIAYKRVRASQ